MKIIKLIIAIIFLLNSTAYSHPALRPPMLGDKLSQHRLKSADNIIEGNSGQWFKKETNRNIRKIDTPDGPALLKEKNEGSGPAEIAIEKKILALFQEDVNFPVPKLINYPGISESQLCMEYISGISLFDLLLLLDKIIDGNYGDSLSADAHIVKIALLKKALTETLYWQSKNEEIIRCLGDSIKRYDYNENSLEAMSVSFKWLLDPGDLKGSIEKDVKILAGILKDKSNYSFRDATPKNTIVRIPELEEEQTRLPFLLEMFKDKKIEEITQYLGNWRHVDFTSSFQLTPPQDDWYSIEGHLRSRLKIEENLFEGFSQITKDDSYDLIIIGRGLRFWGRRVAYLFEEPGIFSQRYKNETENLDFFLRDILAAIERLRNNRPGQDFLGSMYRYFLLVKTGEINIESGIVRKSL